MEPAETEMKWAWGPCRRITRLTGERHGRMLFICYPVRILLVPGLRPDLILVLIGVSLFRRKWLYMQS